MGERGPRGTRLGGLLRWTTGKRSWYCTAGSTYTTTPGTPACRPRIPQPVSSLTLGRCAALVPGLWGPADGVDHRCGEVHIGCSAAPGRFGIVHSLLKMLKKWKKYTFRHHWGIPDGIQNVGELVRSCCCSFRPKWGTPEGTGNVRKCRRTSTEYA